MDLIIPQILPDEWLPGYRGRIAAYNGMNSTKEVARQLAEIYPRAAHWQNQTLTFIDAAAQANNISDDELLHRHSCLSIFTGLRTHSHETLTNKRALSGVRSMAMYSAGQKARGCDECILADLQQCSTAYWRRSHQIPGHFLCQEHAHPLWCISATELLPPGPDIVAHKATAFDSTTLAQIRENPHIFQALSLLDMLVRDRIVLDRTNCANAFKKKLITNDASAFKRGWIPALAAKIQKTFETRWLQYFMPGTDINTHSLLQLVKRCIHVNSATPSYMNISLVASIIFSSAEEALASVK